MAGGSVHYELYLARKAGAPWELDHAGPDRAAVLEAAETLLAERRCVAVRVSKEVFDADAGVFRSVVIVEKGEVRAPRKPPAERHAGPLCTGPNDLYTAHARERIARLMEPVLRRWGVTPWELLHRPDIAEALDASAVEIQGAVQRVAIPEAQAAGVSTHEMMRVFQALADKALERLVRDGRRRAFPDADPSAFATSAGRLCDHGDGAYLLGGGVAAWLAGADGWRDKAGRLAQLLEAAPEVGRPRALACRVLEPPLAEMLGGAAPLGEVIGAELDLGGQLAVLVRIAARPEVEAVCALDPEIARALPVLSGPAARLAERLDVPGFEAVRSAVGARILAELTGPRRLRPADPEGEIAILRALAAVLAAAVGRLLGREDVQAAFVERSKRLVASDFVDSYLAGRTGAVEEARALVRLCENLTGPINRRAGARWLLATIDSLRFEKEVRGGPDSPGARLAALAALQRETRRAKLPEAEEAAAVARIGEAGGWVEQDGRLVASILRSDAALLARVGALMRLSTGEAAPLGPAADRARAECAKLVRRPEVRAELAADPAAARRLQALAADEKAGPGGAAAA